LILGSTVGENTKEEETAKGSFKGIREIVTIDSEIFDGNKSL
jgi:hypothetical protein